MVEFNQITQTKLGGNSLALGKFQLGFRDGCRRPIKSKVTRLFVLSNRNILRWFELNVISFLEEQQNNGDIP